MASIIRSIAFKNFYNYYGDFKGNEYNFSEGLNIVNADNGMGKSKMFNGILWILSDMVYDSDTREKETVTHAALKMLSKKARAKELQPETAVKLVFQDEINIYTITKSIKFIKQTATSNPEDKDAWTVCSPEVEVKKENIVSHKSSFVYSLDEQDEIIREHLLSRSLQSYSLLQGEAIDNIVDLSDSTKLSRTIETLTDLSQLNAIETSTATFARNADRELESKQKASANNLAEFEKAEAEKKGFENQIEKTKESISLYKSELQIATEEADKYASQLSNTEKRIEYREKVKRLNDEIRILGIKLSDLQDGINDNLFSKPLPWILLGAENYIDIFNEKRDNYIQELLAEQAAVRPVDYFASILPEGSPDDVSLEKMLAECKCFVCGRPFDKDDDHYKHIEMLRNRSKQRPTADAPKLKAFFGDIQKSVAGFMRVDDSIKAKVAESRLAEKKIIAQIGEKHKELNNAITDLQNYGGSTTNLDGTSDENVLSKYNKAINDMKRLDDYIKSAEDSLKTLEEKCKDKANQMAMFGGAAVPQANRDLKEILGDVNTIITNTKKRIFDEVLDTLEKKSNDFYQKLTIGGNVEGGKLVFSKTSYDAIQLKVVTPTGGEFTGASEGFQRMKKIAVVMAIISSKFGGGHFDYPFIADAPFSAFGKNFIGNFFEAVPDVFNQCIIMIKDLYDPSSEELISEDGKKILAKMKSGEIKGSFFVNYIPEDTDNSGMVTKIKQYK